MRPATAGSTIATPARPGFSRTGCAGVLREDDHPALYVYHQTFEVDGKTHTRKGFLARVRLEPFGQGKIYPHEQTLAGPKADRLALYHATGFNLSPVFGLYPDADRRRAPHARGRLARSHAAGGDRSPGRRKPALARDRSRDAHRRQRTDGRQAGLHRRRPPPLRDRPEVSRRTRGERRTRPATTTHRNFCLMMLVGMSDPGLLILPTHRLVSGFPGLTAET